MLLRVAIALLVVIASVVALVRYFNDDWVRAEVARHLRNPSVLDGSVVESGNALDIIESNFTASLHLTAGSAARLIESYPPFAACGGSHQCLPIPGWDPDAAFYDSSVEVPLDSSCARSEARPEGTDRDVYLCVSPSTEMLYYSAVDIGGF